MRSIYLSLKINRIQTHQFKHQTRDMTRDFRDKTWFKAL